MDHTPFVLALTALQIMIGIEGAHTILGDLCPIRWLLILGYTLVLLRLSINLLARPDRPNHT